MIISEEGILLYFYIYEKGLRPKTTTSQLETNEKETKITETFLW